MRARTSQRRCAGAFLSALSIALLLGRYSSPIPRADDCICRLPFPPPESVIVRAMIRHVGIFQQFVIRAVHFPFAACSELPSARHAANIVQQPQAAAGSAFMSLYEGQQRAKSRNTSHMRAVRANILGFVVRNASARLAPQSFKAVFLITHTAKYSSSAFRFQNTIVPGTRIISTGHAFPIESLLPFARRQPPAPRRLS